MRFDLETSCAVLQRLEETTGARSEADSLRLAAMALHFISGQGSLLDFEDYLACFEAELPEASLPRFATRELAQDELRQAAVSAVSPCVVVAGRRHSMGYSLDEGERFLIPVPSKEEVRTVGPGSMPRLVSGVHGLLRAEVHATSSEEHACLQLALLAFHFIGESGRWVEFERFTRLFDTQAPVLPLRVFSSRQEAERWLSDHPRPPHGVQVQIAGQRFVVGYDRETALRVLVRSPSLHELGLSRAPDDSAG
ncbi:hypothetical protein [Archangium primigenium]|uniref:hypothetical protein n=1 Tax=[Archangium] primigenium TaxID=2792470 RepID=UPI00195BFEEC|nr:hypothetical protein [Archangium primigenium]MBM7118670.1 hypothetical protein [Archangium primigenium]